MQGARRAMTEFDREQLIAALAAGGIRADEDTIGQVWCRLHIIQFAYLAYSKGYIVGRAKPSRELRRLNEALLEWHNSDDWAWEAYLIHRFDGLKLSAMEWFYLTVGEMVDRLEMTRKRTRQEDPRTTALLALYHCYVELTGKTGLGDGDGPGIRFITECAALIDVPVPRLLRQTLQAALAREKRLDEATLQK
jgi:hypothetical protein